MNTPIRTGRTRQSKRLSEIDGQRPFHFLLYGVGIVLDLESTVIGAFIGDFQEVSGHIAE